MIQLVYWSAAALAGLVALFWLAALLGTIVEHRRQKWVVKVATPLPEPPRRPPVTVLIPARNEERNLKTCLDAVRALDWPELQILVTDDRSTDATGRIAAEAAAADPRITVLGGSEPPEGWMGKSWALHQAVHHAKGEWLLFLDADVRVHPKSLRQAHAYAVAQGASMFSGYGTLVMESFWERVMMPVIGGLIVGGNPLREVNDPAHPRVVCNGQFILITRAAYDAIGGHAAIRAEIIDDVAMAREAKGKKISYRMVFCRELFATRMYTGFGEVWRGWRKNLFAGLGYRPGLALVVVAFILVFSVLPPFALAAWWWTLRGAEGAPRHDVIFLLLAAATALLFTHRLYTARIFGHSLALAWTHPVGALLAAGIFADSALRGFAGGTVDWKGRAYAARRPGPAPDAPPRP